MILPVRPSQAPRTITDRQKQHQKIAVLALQGSVSLHLKKIEQAGFEAIELRQLPQLNGVTHLVIPGGESTTLYKLLTFYGLWAAIAARIRNESMAVLGTCAGSILLGREHETPPPRWGLLDVEIERNAYGRQLQSFVGTLEPTEKMPFHALDSIKEGVFIRAPRFVNTGNPVNILASCDGKPVLVQQGRILASTFHPELSTGHAVHELFLGL